MPQDVIFYYERVFPKLKKFLKNREIATKTYLKNLDIIKRGSNSPPLYIEALIKGVDKKFLNLRKGNSHLKEVKQKLTKNQINIWNYFVPRKLIELHYAVNHEHQNKPLQRLFFDIDRLDVPAEKAQLVAQKLIEAIQKDKTFKFKKKIFPLWTGNSFHLYIFLKKQLPHSFYEKCIHVNTKNPEASFTGKWAKKINKEIKTVKISAGHEKKKGHIIIDPSLSPSGKIARCPFSLYIKSYSKIKGVAIPLSIKDMYKKSLIKELREYTPEKVINNINKLSKNLP